MIPIRDIRASSAQSVRVHFGKPIRGELAVMDPDRYIFSNGLQAVAVAVAADYIVEVFTTEQERDRPYTLTFRG